jgi:endonuclease/exonuclease/phosphatase family metal-dependent hydrolase
VYGRAAVRVLTWNLFHGRTVPRSGLLQLGAFATLLAGWEWDVALLQEVPPWWPPALAAAAGADWRRALTSRNAGMPVRRRLAERRPDLMRSSGGGANAILVRRSEIAEHRSGLLRLWPERRLVHAVRLAGGTWVANVHAQVRPAVRAAADVTRAARIAARWAGRAPLVLGGDLNLRRPELPGFVLAAGHGIDFVWARGLGPAGPAEVLDSGRLSDHAPVAVELRPAAPGARTAPGAPRRG